MNNTQGTVMPQNSENDVTIIVTPRERFSEAIRSLHAISEMTGNPYHLIYIDGNSPRTIAKELREICETHGYRYVRKDHFLTPNQARNMGARLAETSYLVFMDNDVIPSDGWLSALVSCANETGAAVVAPLTCQKEPLHEEVHQAGGEFTEDLEIFLKASPAERRIADVHLLQGEKIKDLELKRQPTQCCEFHCTLVRKDAFVKYGELDENLLATKEHLDFCMTVWTQGGEVIFEPKSIVTYLFPSRSSPLTLEDWPYFALRWSPVWLHQSLDHFQAKWGLSHDPYFDDRRSRVMWRHDIGIAKPLLKRLPLVKKSYRASTIAHRAIISGLEVWSRYMARKQAQRTASE